MPYLDDYWRDMIEVRGIEGFDSRSLSAAGAGERAARLARRPDPGRRDASSGSRRELLDRWQLGGAILNCLYGVQQINDEGLEAALCSAVNDWLAAEWLDRDPRLAASIVIPMQNPARAVEEIERWAGRPALRPGADAGDARSALRPALLVADLSSRPSAMDLPIGLHLGSAYRRAITAVGWPSYHVEDYVDQTQGMQAQLAQPGEPRRVREVPAT